jgi:hypothetical protein
MKRRSLLSHASTVACMVLLPLSASACGFIFSHGPPEGHENMDYISCTESNAGPIVDIVWGALNVLGALTVASDPSSYDSPDQTVAIGLSWGVVSGTAAAVGFNKSRRCRAAKQQLAARQAHAPPVQGAIDPAGQAVVEAVVITPQLDTLSVGERVQLVASAHRSSGAVVANKFFSWSSSNDAIASVSSAGLVTAHASGSVVIAARTDNTVGTANVVVVSPR